MMNYKTSYAFLLTISALIFIWGCSASPSKGTVEMLITKHFESGPYNVMSIVIGDIEPIPARDKQYMGTEGYIVYVPAVTLQFTRDIGAPWNYKMGQYMTFNDATVRIKRRPGKQDDWIIVDIAGVPVL